MKIGFTFQLTVLLACIITPGLFAQNTTEVPLIRAVLYNISEVENVLTEGAGYTEMTYLLETNGAK